MYMYAYVFVYDSFYLPTRALLFILCFHCYYYLKGL